MVLRWRRLLPRQSSLLLRRVSVVWRWTIVCVMLSSHASVTGVNHSQSITSRECLTWYQRSVCLSNCLKSISTNQQKVANHHWVVQRFGLGMRLNVRLLRSHWLTIRLYSHWSWIRCQALQVVQHTIFAIWTHTMTKHLWAKRQTSIGRM